MSLDLSSLKKAIKQLEDALDICESGIYKDLDPRIERQLRAGAIQAFEFTYELSWKLIKRYLEISEASPEFSDISFHDLIRKAYEKGLLLNDLETWRAYRKQRGITSHTYDEYKAETVYLSIPDFLKEAKYLFSELERRGLNAE